jgi:hypothetical protein
MSISPRSLARVGAVLLAASAVIAAAMVQLRPSSLMDQAIIFEVGTVYATGIYLALIRRAQALGL